MKKVIMIIQFFVVCMLISCNSETGTDGKNSGISSRSLEKGQMVYKSQCFACHRMDGAGIPGQYPPLAGNPTVTGDKLPLINIILTGISGEIEVNGTKYNHEMIPYDFLSNEEIADVLNYIRNNFGNKAEEIKPRDVRKARK